MVSSNDLVPPESSEFIQHPNLAIRRLPDPLSSIRDKLSRNRLGRIVFALLHGFLWPDRTVLWALRTARAIDVSKYDRILVSILPTSMMILAWINRVDSRWVFDFQETASPSRLGNRRSPVYRRLIPLYTGLQRAVLKKTDHVIFASESYIEDYVTHDLVEKEKVVHVPFFYDNLSIRRARAAADKFVISYFGGFSKRDGGRSPEVFLRALGRFLERNPSARKLTEFRFYGSWIKEHSKHVSQVGVQDVMSINSAVPFDRYVELLSDSVVLLLVTCKTDNLFVPSKMLDYFGAQRPILGFVPSDSETYRILEKAKMEQYVSAEPDVEGGARSLEKLWHLWGEGRSACSFKHVEQWSASVQVPRVVQLLSED